MKMITDYEMYTLADCGKVFLTFDDFDTQWRNVTAKFVDNALVLYEGSKQSASLLEMPKKYIKKIKKLGVVCVVDVSDDGNALSTTEVELQR